MQWWKLLGRCVAVVVSLVALAACAGADPDQDEIPDLKPETGAERSPEITDITEDSIRDVILPDTDLVDVKVCAVDAIWSGLKLMIRKDRR